MKKKKADLLNLLLDQEQPVSSKSLANTLGISPRTVKNYVRELNELADQPMIQASNAGYLLNRELARPYLEEPEDSVIPIDFEGRALFYLKEILVNNRELTIYDLENQLFVSDSTIRSDISRMNKSYGNKDLRFQIRDDQLFVVGEEKERRKLISSLLFEEMPHQFIDESILKEHFDEDAVMKISEIIRNVTKETNYYLNDFAFMNLVLHLLILVESIQAGHTLTARETSSVWLEKNKAHLVNLLIDQLEEHFDITMNLSDREEMHVLFQANANYVPTNDLEQIKTIVGDDLLQKLERIVANVQQTFGVDLSSKSFMMPFSLHLSGLTARIKEDSFIKNPMLESIKRDFPMVYTLAVSISLELSEIYNKSIPEDESAYIALHIGSELENQKRNKEKLTTAILCPNYMNLDVTLYQAIKSYFDEELNIVTLAANFSELSDQDFDLLITTVDAPTSNQYHLVRISPLLNDQQKKHLVSEVTNLRLYKKRQILLDNFDQYFQPEYFFVNPKAKDKPSLIQQISDAFEQEGIVGSAFYQHVLEREKAAPCAYETVAIPHSVHPEAAQTKIAVALLARGMDWGTDKNIQIVLLPAISDKDRTQFFSIYEAVISLFDEANIYQELLRIKTFDEFRKFVFAKFSTY